MTSSSGNKSDLVNEREVATSVGEEFARRHQMSFLETSALAASNVDVLFTDIARRLVADAARNGLAHGRRSSSSSHLGSSRPIGMLQSYCGCQSNWHPVNRHSFFDAIGRAVWSRGFLRRSQPLMLRSSPRTWFKIMFVLFLNDG